MWGGVGLNSGKAKETCTIITRSCISRSSLLEHTQKEIKFPKFRDFGLTFNSAALRAHVKSKKKNWKTDLEQRGANS